MPDRRSEFENEKGSFEASSPRPEVPPDQARGAPRGNIS